MNIQPHSVSNKDPISTLGFTDDQRNAYYKLIEFINSPYDAKSFKRALIGPAGTGKTYLVKALIRNCNLTHSIIGLAAPTHKACRVLQESIALPNIKVNTLGSDLGLRPNYNLDNFDINNVPFDPKGKIKIGDYRLYIVDESSMMPRSLVTLLERTAKSNQCKIIYIGDGSQLPPPKEKYSSALRGVETYTLSKIVRQEDDNPIRYLLDLLRYDIKHKTFKFLEYISRNKEKFDSGGTKGYAVCNQQEFNDKVFINFSDEQLTQNVDYAKVIAYTNIAVTGWNNVIRNTIIKDAHKAVITKNDLFISYTTLVNSFNEVVLKNSEEYIVYDIVNYTHPRYDLKGFMVRFQAIHGGQTTTPIFVLDHTDAFSIQKYLEVSNNFINLAKTAKSTVRAERWRQYYEFKESCLLLKPIIRRDNTVLYSRDLDYGFALTSHKSQGSTFDTVLVDVNDIVYDRFGHPYTDCEEINRRLYVACSRCRNKLYLRYGF